MGWGRGPELLRAPSHGCGGTSKAVSPLSLCVFHGAHKPVFCQGPRKSYAEVVLGGCSGVQGTTKSVHLQWEMAWSQILALLLTQHRS